MSFNIEQIEYILGETTREIEEYCLSRNKDYSRLIQKTGFTRTHFTKKTDLDFFGDFLKSNLKVLTDDAVILVNQSGRYAIPGILPKLLSKTTNVADISTFQISDGCTGFAKSLVLADSLLLSNKFNRVHLICAEKYSDYINEDNEALIPIFSDAISVTSLGTGSKVEIVSVSAINNFDDYSKISIDSNSESFYMEGSSVYGWVTANTVPQIEKILLRNNLSIREIRSWQFHQASRVMLEGILNRLGVSNEFVFNSSEIGNTASSSLPINIKNSTGSPNDLYENGYHILAGFGVGLSSIVILIKVNL